MKKPTKISLVVGSKIEIVNAFPSILAEFPLVVGASISGTAWIEVKAKSATDFFVSRSELQFSAVLSAPGVMTIDFSETEVLARTNPPVFNVIASIEVVRNTGDVATLIITPSFVGLPITATAQVTLVEPSFAYHLL